MLLDYVKWSFYSLQNHEIMKRGELISMEQTEGL